MLPGTHRSLANLNGPDPIASVICVLGSVSASFSRMMIGTELMVLPSEFEHEAVRLAQDEAERLVVDGFEFLGEAEQTLADAVACAPASERGDHVLGGDRTAVVELEAVAQRERIGLAVGADVVAVDHLRLRPDVGIVSEQRVVDQHAVDGGDRLRRPERVEHADVGVQHRAQHLFLRLHGRCDPKGRGQHCGGDSPSTKRRNGLSDHGDLSW